MSTVTTTPHTTDPNTAESAAQRPSDQPKRAGTARQLLRLWPYLRPELRWLVLSTGLAFAAMLSAMAMPLLVQRIVDGPIADRDLPGLWLPCSLLLVAGIAESALFAARRLVVARPALRVQATMRTDLYDRLQQLPVSYHEHIGSGQLLSRMVSDLATIRLFLGFAGIFLVVNSLTFVTGMALLFTLNWQLAAVVLSLALPLVVLMVRFDRRYGVLARRAQDQVGDLATTAEEAVLGIRILKAFGRSRQRGELFRAESGQLRDTELSKARMLARLWAVILAPPEVAAALCLLIGVPQVADGRMSAGTLVAFLTVLAIIRWPIDSLGWLLNQLNEAATATGRFFEVMDHPVELTTPSAPRELPASGRGGDLKFERVRFGFPDAPDRPVLDGVDLHLHPGRTLAIVGATGSGKTALTLLVNRLYDVSGGRILLDGIDIRDLALSELRAAVSVAFEEPVLFSASVRENITLGRPASSAAEIERAIDVAQAGFVRELPWGLDTRIGEQGLSLSGGQRQRLALARAVLGNPRVLVLDDPLSALDIHTEAAVEDALRSVLHHTTALIIAHRASTVLMADQVALLQDGRITAIGTHHELLATVPSYRALLSDAAPEVVRNAP